MIPFYFERPEPQPRCSDSQKYDLVSELKKHCYEESRERYMIFMVVDGLRTRKELCQTSRFTSLRGRQTNSMLCFETKRRLGMSGVLHMTSSCLQKQSSLNARPHSTPDHRISWEDVRWSFRTRHIGLIRMIPASICRNERRQIKFRTNQRTGSRPHVEGRVTALFRCTFNPMVLRSYSLETTISSHRLTASRTTRCAPEDNNSQIAMRDSWFQPHAVSVFWCFLRHFGVRTQDGRII